MERRLFNWLIGRKYFLFSPTLKILPSNVWKIQQHRNLLCLAYSIEMFSSMSWASTFSVASHQWLSLAKSTVARVSSETFSAADFDRSNSSASCKRIVLLEPYLQFHLKYPSDRHKLNNIVCWWYCKYPKIIWRDIPDQKELKAQNTLNELKCSVWD